MRIRNFLFKEGKRKLPRAEERIIFSSRTSNPCDGQICRFGNDHILPCSRHSNILCSSDDRVLLSPYHSHIRRSSDGHVLRLCHAKEQYSIRQEIQALLPSQSSISSFFSCQYPLLFFIILTEVIPRWDCTPGTINVFGFPDDHFPTRFCSGNNSCLITGCRLNARLRALGKIPTFVPPRGLDRSSVVSLYFLCTPITGWIIEDIRRNRGPGDLIQGPCRVHVARVRTITRSKRRLHRFTSLSA